MKIRIIHVELVFQGELDEEYLFDVDSEEVKITFSEAKKMNFITRVETVSNCCRRIINLDKFRLSAFDIID